MIETNCSCGKSWKSSEGARGRSMPCPGCGKPTVIGGGPAATPMGAQSPRNETSTEALLRGRDLAAAGRAAEARLAYERAVELDPRNGGVHYLLGNHLLFGMKLFVEAKDTYLRALKLWDDPGNWTNLGLCMAVMGYPDQAIGCFDRALATAPHAIPMFYKAYALSLKPDKAGSQACLAEARRMDPTGELLTQGQALLAKLR